MQYKDLPHNAQLAVTIWGRAVANPLTPLASATLRLFSKRGRLKTGPQTAHLWLGSAAHPDWLGATPAKPPVEERGEIGCALHWDLCHRVRGVLDWDVSAS